MATRVASLVRASVEEVHVSIVVPDNLDVEISDVSDLMEAIAKAVRQDAGIVCSSSWGRELRVTVLYSVAS